MLFLSASGLMVLVSIASRILIKGTLIQVKA
jgi:hypothetical protein